MASLAGFRRSNARTAMPEKNVKYARWALRKHLMNAVFKIGWGMFLSSIYCAGASGAGMHHYVFFNRDREKISDAVFLETKTFEGAQLKYTWRELERGKDDYD